MSQMATVPRGQLPLCDICLSGTNATFYQTKKSSQDGKSLRVANVSERQMSRQLSPRGQLPLCDICLFGTNSTFYQLKKSSQDGKSLKVANVPRGTFAILGHLPLWYKCHFQPILVKLCQNGKCLKVANVSGWQMSQGGKCPRVANVTGRQMSRPAKVTRQIYPFFGCWLKVAFVQGRQMSRPANVTGGKWNAAKVQKLK